MSKFKPSAITPDHRGKLGNIVFSKNRYGPYDVLKTNPRKDRTEAQRNTNGDMGNLSRAWSDKISAKQHEDWSRFALNFKRTDTSGNTYTLAPRDVFMSCNSNLKEVGLPVIFDAPANIPPQTFDSFTLETSADNWILKLNLFIKPEIKEDTRILIFATDFLRNSKYYFKDTWFRVIGYINSSFKSGDSIVSIYQSRFENVLSTDYKIAFRLKPVSAISGISSPVIKTSASSGENSQA